MYGRLKRQTYCQFTVLWIFQMTVTPLFSGQYEMFPSWFINCCDKLTIAWCHMGSHIYASQIKNWEYVFMFKLSVGVQDFVSNWGNQTPNTRPCNIMDCVRTLTLANWKYSQILKHCFKKHSVQTMKFQLGTVSGKGLTYCKM